MTSETVQQHLQDAQEALGSFLATLLDDDASLELGAPTETDTTPLQDDLEKGLAVGVDNVFLVALDMAWVSLVSESMLGRSIDIDDEGVDDLFREIAAQGYGTLRNQLSTSGVTLPEVSIQPSLPGSGLPALPDAAWRVPFQLTHDGKTYGGYVLLRQSEDAAPADAREAQGTGAPSASAEASSEPREEEPAGAPQAAGGSGVSVAPAKFSDLGEERIHGPRAEENNFDLLAEVELEVSVELGRRLLPLSEVLQLTTGSVIELEKLVGEPLSIYANGRFVAEGEAVVIDEKFGIRITNLAPKKQRSEALL